MRVWVVRAVEYSGRPFAGVFEELRNGRARIARSSGDDQDLRLLEGALAAGRPLDAGQREARRYLRFRTEVAIGDHLLYPHQPERNRFTVVEVTGDYGYDEEGDRGSRRPCRFLASVSMRDEIVPPALRRRLGRPGRLSEIRARTAYEQFRNDLPRLRQIRDGTTRRAVNRIHDDLRKLLPDAVRREFTQADLSGRLCPELFDRMGYDHETPGGRGEKGVEVVVTVGDPLLPDGVEFRVGVRTFAFYGKIEARAIDRILRRLLREWDGNALDYGVLLTTGTCAADAREVLNRHNRENPERLVRLIEADHLADLFLQVFPPVGEERGNG